MASESAWRDKRAGESAPDAAGVVRPVGHVHRVALVLAVSLALLGFDLGAWVLATNDETRFPMLARDILASGHWLLPRLNGAPHLNKPPLQAWLIALASWPTGAVTPWSAAVPSVLAALGVVLGTYWLAQRLFDAAVAVRAGLLVVTTYGVFALARVPLPDMSLCAAFTAALGMFVAAEFDGRRGALVAFYALVGVASWVKGPVALLALPVAGVYVVTTSGWAGCRRLVSPAGLLVLALLSLPWWVLGAVVGGGGFAQDVVRDDLLRWYLPSGRGGWRALSEPLAQTFTVLLPWSLVLPVALWWALRAEGAPRRRLRVALVWLAVSFLLVGLSGQQRMRYYLLLCPPAALVLASWAASLPLRRGTAVFAWSWGIVALGMSLWQVHAVARHNAATDLRAVVLELRGAGPAPLYAVEVPELVVAFALGAPVVPLPSYAQFARQAPSGAGPAYLVIADRAVPASPVAQGVQRVAGGRVNGRPVSVLRRE